jgi:6-pyruvoyltetrahydropterin/6-carboxytetrahydropterin synthase
MHVEREFKFEAAHMLPRHNGKCRNEHGHSWRVVVSPLGTIDKETQFVMDFSELKKLVQPIIDRFDHQHLNAFITYPSSENVCIHIAHLLRPSLARYHFSVRVSETQTSWAEWNSMNPYDMSIFDADALDSAIGAMDAEWRSPNPGHVQDIPTSIAELEAILPTLLNQWIRANAELQQLMLYRDSLTPVNPEEFKALKGVE